MKQQFVQDLKPGDSVDDIFVLADKALHRKKDGNPYLNVAFTDKTGTVKGVVWDNVEQMTAVAGVGDYVHLKGLVGEYRNALQVVVSAIRSCNAEAVAREDFLPVSPFNREAMLERLKALTATITHPHLKALMAAFWNDADWVAQFKAAPAAKFMHHAYIGGLLEHTLSMASLADKIAAHYRGVDRDLLLVGVVLHDIGKTREFSYLTGIDYTHEGRLVSHIAIGLEMLDAKLKLIDGFPSDVALLIKHMIISHHGSREFGSPEPPKTVEAVLLNYIDEIDSKVSGIREFMASEDPEAPWTSYHKLLGRHFYKGSVEK
jgi:3'-5' exoribonuclease